MNWTPIVAPVLSVAGITSIFILLSFCLVRRLQRAWSLYKFPHKKIPLNQNAFGRGKLFQLVSKETEENSTTDPLIPDVPIPAGWMQHGTNIVNYAKFVQKLPFILDKTISLFDPALSRQPNQSIEEYYIATKNRLPQNDFEWKTIISIYQNCTFGENEISRDEYDSFMKSLSIILKSLTKTSE